jgi:glutaredoxin-like YruB-family protein
MSVTVYTTPTCGFCHQLKNYLRQRGIPFAEHDVSRDPYRANEMVRLSGQQGVPVSVIDGNVVLGADMGRINQVLAQRAGSSPKLGLSIADADRIATKKGTQLPKGAYVGRVRPASAGALAGVQPGDLIVQLAGQPVQGKEDVHRISDRLQFVQQVDLVVWRTGQRIGMRTRV